MPSSLKNNYHLILSFLIIFIASIFSVGFLHPDEHYQILELLNLKLPKTYSDLSLFNWDYNLKIRPWIQVFFYYLFIFPVNFLDGFSQAFLIRLLNGLIGGYSIYCLCQYYFKENYKKALLALFSLWFIPLLLVRTNSESLSASLFFLGFLSYKKDKKNIGMLFWGLSFLVRYQMAIMVAPIIIFDLFKRRLEITKAFQMLGTLLLTLGIGALTDRWGYGTWELAPYNYFYQNLVLDKASNFGTDPFYYYFYKPILKGIPPISLILLWFGGKFWWNKRNEGLFWGIVFFILIHSLIPHKEVRFLTPVYLLVSVGAIYEISKIKIKKALLYPVLAINLILLIKVISSPAHSRIALYKFMYKNKIDSIKVPNENPKFEFTMPFYSKKKIQTVPDTNSVKGLNLTLKYDQQKRYASRNCTKVLSQYPNWIIKFNYFNWLKRSSFYVIWDCQ